MNAFMLHHRDQHPVRLGTGHEIVPSIVSPLSSRLQSGQRYSKLFGDETLLLHSVGFLVTATPEYTDMAILRRLTAASIVIEDSGIDAGDCFVLANGGHTAARATLSLSAWNESLTNDWLPVAFSSRQPVAGWLRQPLGTNGAEAILVGQHFDVAEVTPVKIKLLYDMSVEASIQDFRITVKWPGARSDGVQL